MYSLENALEMWDKAGKYGSPEERTARSKQWEPYYSYLAECQTGEVYCPSEQAVGLVEFLIRENILRIGDCVLDIGAGMGSFALEFAKRCSKVSALDINNTCLKVLTERAEQLGLQNIRIVPEPWETYRATGKFDITFSAMCPAICNKEELLRLESMTRRTACLYTVTRGSYEKHRMELMKLFPNRQPAGMVSEALHYYNVLYLMGRQPNIKTWSKYFEYKVAEIEYVKRYSTYLQVFGIGDDESVPKLKDYFKHHSQDGAINETCQMNTALIYWDVLGETK